MCVPRTKEEGITAAPAHSALSQYKRRRKKVAQPKASKSDGDDTSTVKAETVSENKQSRGRPRKTQKREKVDKTEIQSNKPLPVGKPAVHAAVRAQSPFHPLLLLIKKNRNRLVPTFVTLYLTIDPTTPASTPPKALFTVTYSTEPLLHGTIWMARSSSVIGNSSIFSLSTPVNGIHSGGKSAEVDDSNERALIDDQFKDDNPVRCMLNNWQYKQPIVMIMGKKLKKTLIQTHLTKTRLEVSYFPHQDAPPISSSRLVHDNACLDGAGSLLGARPLQVSFREGGTSRVKLVGSSGNAREKRRIPPCSRD